MTSGEISYGTTYTYYPTTGTFIYPNTFTYPWSGSEHQSKCVSCGYCPCCGRSDVRPEDGPVPGDGSDGGVHGTEGA